MSQRIVDFFERLNVRKYFKTTIVATIILTLVVVFAIGKIFGGKNGKSDKGTVVRLENPQRGDLVELVSAPGEIQPKTKVEISAKVSARIVELPYAEGQKVTCGNPNADPPIPPSVLIRLDSKDLESRLRSARASRMAQVAHIEVEKARVQSRKADLEGTAASLKQAGLDLQRQQKLLKSQDISQSTFDNTKCSLDQIRARYNAAEKDLKAAELNLVVLRHNLEAADATIEQAQENLSYTTITAPIDGVVTRINAEVGELVVYGTMNNAGTVIMEVADLSQMTLLAEVDETDVGKLELGQKATVHVQAYRDEEFDGIVDSIALTHDWTRNGAKYFKTEILLTENSRKLYTGLTADVDIETYKHTDVLKVPSQAVLGRKVDSLPMDIREDNTLVNKDKTYATVVYRYNDAKSIVTPVKIGASDLTHTIVLDGITPEDKVVIGPYKALEGLKHDKKLRDEVEVEAEKKKQKKDKKTDPKKEKTKA